MAYWRVDDIGVAVTHFTSTGATIVSAVQDVGEGIIVATVADPFGNLIGLIRESALRAALRERAHREAGSLQKQILQVFRPSW